MRDGHRTEAAGVSENHLTVHSGSQAVPTTKPFVEIRLQESGHPIAGVHEPAEYTHSTVAEALVTVTHLMAKQMFETHGGEFTEEEIRDAMVDAYRDELGQPDNYFFTPESR